MTWYSPHNLFSLELNFVSFHMPVQSMFAIFSKLTYFLMPYNIILGEQTTDQ
jgi:hypothetical protein